MSMDMWRLIGIYESPKALLRMQPGGYVLPGLLRKERNRTRDSPYLALCPEDEVGFLNHLPSVDGEHDNIDG